MQGHGEVVAPKTLCKINCLYSVISSMVFGSRYSALSTAMVDWLLILVLAASPAFFVAPLLFSG